MSPTYKQRLFISAFLDPTRANGNASEAARIAGYCSPLKYATRLLAKPAIRAAIDAKLDEVAMSTNESLARVSEIAGASIGDLIDIHDDGSWSVDVPKAKRAQRLGTVRKLKHRRDVRQDSNGNETVTEHIEIEMYSKLDALDKLMRYHGLYRDKLDVTSNGASVGPQVVLYLPDNGRDTELKPEPIRLAKGTA